MWMHWPTADAAKKGREKQALNCETRDAQTLSTETSVFPNVHRRVPQLPKLDVGPKKKSAFAKELRNPDKSKWSGTRSDGRQQKAG